MKGFIKTAKGSVRWSDLVENGLVKMEYGKLLSVSPKLSGILYLDDSVICIGSKCFNSCKGLRQIILNDDLQLIGSYAFAMCTKLEQIVIPGNVTKIGAGITIGCTSLVKLQVDPSNPYYSSDNNCILDQDSIIAGCCESTIRNHKCVAKYAFSGLTKDKWDIFNTELVQEGAFYGCKIDDLLISTDEFTECKIEDNAFKDSKLNGVTLSGNISYEQNSFSGTQVYKADHVMNVDFGGDIQQIAIFGGDSSEE